MQDRADDARLCHAGECLLAGQHFVQDRAEREDVGARVGLAAVELLGCHVLQRAENLSGGGERAHFGRHAGYTGVTRRAPRVDGIAGRLREAEIQEGGAAAGQHDVGGLEIAMHHAVAVRVVERVGELNRDGQRLRHR